jgi:hypothetical protein
MGFEGPTRTWMNQVGLVPAASGLLGLILPPHLFVAPQVGRGNAKRYLWADNALDPIRSVCPYYCHSERIEAAPFFLAPDIIILSDNNTI